MEQFPIDDQKTSLIGQKLFVKQNTSEVPHRFDLLGIQTFLDMYRIQVLGLVGAYHDRKHCILFGDGKVCWCRVLDEHDQLLKGVRIAYSHSHDKRINFSADGKVRLQNEKESRRMSTPITKLEYPMLSNKDSINNEKDEFSVYLGGGSVSNVRSGYLTHAKDNRKGEDVERDITWEKEESLAIKFFKTSQEIWADLPEDDGSTFSLYPEAALREVTSCQVLSPHPNIVRYIGAMRYNELNLSRPLRQEDGCQGHVEGRKGQKRQSQSNGQKRVKSKCGEKEDVIDDGKEKADTPGSVRQVLGMRFPAHVVVQLGRNSFELEAATPSSVPHATQMQQSHDQIGDIGDTVDEKLSSEFKSSSLAVIFQLEETTLEQLLLERSAKPLPPSRAVGLLWQLLCAVEHVHSHGLVHRNIKPAQLLLSQRQGHEQLRLCGFSHTIALQNGGVWEHVEQQESGTLWYRAPESLLGTSITTNAVDIWSVGAVFCEMLIGYPCFSGSSGSSTELGTLWNIFQLQGVPTTRAWPDVESTGRELFPNWGERNIAQQLKLTDCLGVHGISLLSSLLAYNPEVRISARDALTHPFFMTPLPPVLRSDNSNLFNLEASYKHRSELQLALDQLDHAIMNRGLPSYLPNCGRSRLSSTETLGHEVECGEGYPRGSGDVSLACLNCSALLQSLSFLLTSSQASDQRMASEALHKMSQAIFLCSPSSPCTAPLCSANNATYLSPRPHSEDLNSSQVIPHFSDMIFMAHSVGDVRIVNRETQIERMESFIAAQMKIYTSLFRHELEADSNRSDGECDLYFRMSNHNVIGVEKKKLIKSEIFLSSFKHQTLDSAHKAVVPILDISPNIFKVIIYYLYFDTLFSISVNQSPGIDGFPKFNGQELCELAMAADRFFIPDLHPILRLEMQQLFQALFLKFLGNYDLFASLEQCCENDESNEMATKRALEKRGHCEEKQDEEDDDFILSPPKKLVKFIGQHNPNLNPSLSHTTTAQTFVSPTKDPKPSQCESIQQPKKRRLSSLMPSPGVADAFPSQTPSEPSPPSSSTTSTTQLQLQPPLFDCNHVATEIRNEVWRLLELSQLLAHDVGSQMSYLEVAAKFLLETLHCEPLAFFADSRYSDNLTPISALISQTLVSEMVKRGVGFVHNQVESNAEEEEDIDTDGSASELNQRQWVGLLDSRALHVFDRRIKLAERQPKPPLCYLHCLQGRLQNMNRPQPSSPTIVQKHRSILLDWHFEVADELELSSECLHLAVVFLDRCLHELPPITCPSFQLLGCAVLMLASKLIEDKPPAVNQFVWLCDQTYTPSQFMLAEYHVTRALNFNLHYITPISLLYSLCAVADSEPCEVHLAELILNAAHHDRILIGTQDAITLASGALYLSRATLFVTSQRFLRSLKQIQIKNSTQCVEIDENSSQDVFEEQNDQYIFEDIVISNYESNISYDVNVLFMNEYQNMLLASYSFIGKKLRNILTKEYHLIPPSPPSPSPSLPSSSSSSSSSSLPSSPSSSSSPPSSPPRDCAIVSPDLNSILWPKHLTSKSQRNFEFLKSFTIPQLLQAQYKLSIMKLGSEDVRPFATFQKFKDSSRDQVATLQPLTSSCLNYILKQ